MLILFLRRSVAYLTDSLLIMIFVRPATFAQRLLGDLDALIYFALELVAIVITAVYIVGSHARWGCTLGKRMFRLRVATLDGAMPPPLTNAFMRWLPMLILGNLAFLASVFAPLGWSDDIYSRDRWHFNVWQIIALFWVLADVVAALLTRSRRSLHDMFAGTVVLEAPNQAMQRTAPRSDA